MTGDNAFETLLKTTGIGLLAGIVGGFWVYFAIHWKAQAYAQTLHPLSRGGYMCSAGSAGLLLGVLSVPAGALFGLCLGAIFLELKRAADRRPLP